MSCTFVRWSIAAKRVKETENKLLKKAEITRKRQRRSEKTPKRNIGVSGSCHVSSFGNGTNTNAGKTNQTAAFSRLRFSLAAPHINTERGRSFVDRVAEEKAGEKCR